MKYVAPRIFKYCWSSSSSLTQSLTVVNYISTFPYVFVIIYSFWRLFLDSFGNSKTVSLCFLISSTLKVQRDKKFVENWMKQKRGKTPHGFAWKICQKTLIPRTRCSAFVMEVEQRRQLLTQKPISVSNR